jgi:putative FmdB family regulatory protein
MPLYEYECTACHRRTEKIQKFSDAELTVCPHCGGGLERTITAAAFSFQGGGWYKDGYGSAKPAAAGEGKGGEGQSGDGQSGKGGDGGGDSAAAVDSSASSATPAAAPSGGAAAAGAAPAAASPAASSTKP